MSSLTVWKFNTPEGADQALTKLESLSKQELVTIEDAAIVSWQPGKKKPKTRQLHSMAGAGALGGAFWGMLFGLLFFIPFFGMAVGAATGALISHFSDYGIDDNFIKQVQSKVTEGTSALFLMTDGAVQDKVTDAVKSSGLKFELFYTNLSKEQEQQLREDFAA